MHSQAIGRIDPAKPVAAGRPMAVMVDGTAISRAAIAREVQHHPAPEPALAWQAAARALVIRQLLLQEARRLAIAAAPAEDEDGRRETDEEALVAALVAREVRTPQADEAACRRYFDRNRRRFRSADLYEARHILIPAAPGDADARAAAAARAGAIIAEVEGDPGAFAAIAAAESACPSGAVGGNLGQIGPGQTVPELEAALAKLTTAGLVAAPIETRYGFHVLWVDRHVRGTELPFDLVRERIAAWLEEKVRRAAIRDYIAVLVGKADIAGVEMSDTATGIDGEERA